MFILLQYHLLLLLRTFTVVIFRKDKCCIDFKIPITRRGIFQLPPNFKTIDFILLSYYVERTCLAIKILLFDAVEIIVLQCCSFFNVKLPI